MKPDFSEFSYGYAVTEELVSILKLTILGAPEFPSLYEEGKKGGYDVKVPTSGNPIFLQFKLSDCMQIKSAKEFKKGLLPIPYYRMHLRPLKHSLQHNLLLDLASTGEKVFYIAPEFHLPSELNSFYLSKSVIQNSAAFSPSDIGILPTDGDHYLAFERGSTFGYRCSDDPTEVSKSTLIRIVSDLSEPSVQSRSLGEDGLRKLADTMIDVLARADVTRAVEALERSGRISRRAVNSIVEEHLKELNGARQIVSERAPVQSVVYVARTFFDSEIVIAASPPP